MGGSRQPLGKLMATRKISFEDAKRQYVHRYTMEHIPNWARTPADRDEEGRYYAPQFRSDCEWYENTKFYGEDGWLGTRRTDCYTTGQTWPLGNWLNEPYKR
jgi:hypothetical protein